MAGRNTSKPTGLRSWFHRDASTTSAQPSKKAKGAEVSESQARCSSSSASPSVSAMQTSRLSSRTYQQQKDADLKNIRQEINVRSIDSERIELEYKGRVQTVRLSGYSHGLAQNVIAEAKWEGVVNEQAAKTDAQKLRTIAIDAAVKSMALDILKAQKQSITKNLRHNAEESKATVDALGTRKTYYLYGFYAC